MLITCLSSLTNTDDLGWLVLSDCTYNTRIFNITLFSYFTYILHTAERAIRRGRKREYSLEHMRANLEVSLLAGQPAAPRKGTFQGIERSQHCRSEPSFDRATLERRTIHSTEILLCLWQSFDHLGEVSRGQC